MTLKALLLVTSIFPAVYLPTVLHAAEWYLDRPVAQSSAKRKKQGGLKVKRFFIVLILLTTAVGTASASTWWVKGDVSSSGDGKTPFTPFKSIQEGIDAAAEGETVIVAKGTYYENIQFRGPNIVLMSGVPGDTSVRDATIIDGGGLGSTVRFSGTEDETCVLTGFTIMYGVHGQGGGAGGIMGGGTHATIEYNLIRSNMAALGGGLFQCHGTIQHNVISGNVAYFGGALGACDGTIQNNTVSENHAEFCGGGLWQCEGTIRNNLIVGNAASSGDEGSGGGLFSCDGSVENNTIVQNHAPLRGGGLEDCRGLIRNCVIWENTASSGPQLFGESSPTYCCIQNWAYGGEGNTWLNPIFVDADGPDDDPYTFDDNDYRLQPLWDASVCIDKGKNEAWMQGATDLDGNVRIFPGLTSATVDMGAYEYDSFRFAVSRFDRTPTGEPRIRWTSRPGERYVVWSRPVLHSTGPIHVIWEEEVSVMALSGSTMWTDYAPSGRRKFYRVEVKP